MDGLTDIRQSNAASGLTVHTYLLSLFYSLLWTHHHLNKQTGYSAGEFTFTASILLIAHFLTPVCLSGRLNFLTEEKDFQLRNLLLSVLSAASLGNLKCFKYNIFKCCNNSASTVDTRRFKLEGGR